MDRQPQHGGDDRGRIDPPVEERLGVHDEDEDADRRGGEERHQVVPDRQREDERHQDEQVVVLPLAQVLLPPEREPDQQRDGQQGDRVDLLVDVGLVPHREGCGAHQDGRSGPHQPEAAVVREVTQHVVDDEEPERVRARAHEGAEEVHPHRHGEPERSEQHRPGP